MFMHICLDILANKNILGRLVLSFQFHLGPIPWVWVFGFCFCLFLIDPYLSLGSCFQPIPIDDLAPWIFLYFVFF